jgi:hypothetical protein
MLAFLLFTGCNPQDATITDGQWFSWLAANSSKVFIDESLPFLEDLSESSYDDSLAISMYECSGRTRTDDGFVREQEGYSYTSGEDCGDIDEIDFESHKFIQNDGYYLLNQSITPWRTEALINGEGDLQMTVHHALPDGEDFRFAFSIDPYFRPTLCTTDTEGNPKVEYMDGSDWVDRWSEDEGEFNIYYLNAGAYQLNPSDTDDYWFLTTDMSSGFGHAKFSAEEFNSIPTAYGNYDEDGGGDDFMYVANRNDVDYTGYDTSVETLREQALGWQDERITASGANIDGTPAFEHKVEGNQWRPINPSSAGLDGWGEVHSSWVRLTKGSEIVEGGTVKGDFQILLTAVESNSQILVTGGFEIEDLREDAWSYPILEDSKRVENSTTFCGGAELGE